MTPPSNTPPDGNPHVSILCGFSTVRPNCVECVKKIQHITKVEAEAVRLRFTLGRVEAESARLRSALEVAQQWLRDIASQAHTYDQTGPADDSRFEDMEQTAGAALDEIRDALSEPSATPALTQEERKEFVFKRWDGALRKMAEGPGAEPSAKTERMWTREAIQKALDVAWHHDSNDQYGSPWFAHEEFWAALEGET